MTSPFTSVPAVEPDEAATMMDDGALMIDVREADEWEVVRIPKAELKPMSTINEWYADLPRDRTIVVQCRSGQRSASVVRALRDQAGFDNAVNLAGGIIAWADSGLAVES